MCKILIADDDEIVTEIVREAFEEYGHEIDEAADGELALKAIHLNRPDLLILDCNMPNMKGLAALQEIRSSPTYFDLPVIMLTGRQSDGDRDIAKWAGADMFISKPFDPHRLVFEAEALLKRYPSRADNDAAG